MLLVTCLKSASFGNCVNFEVKETPISPIDEPVRAPLSFLKKPLETLLFSGLAPALGLSLRIVTASTGFSLKTCPMFYFASMFMRFSANDLVFGSTSIWAYYY
jgi:hypothetical protein